MLAVGIHECRRAMILLEKESYASTNRIELVPDIFSACVVCRLSISNVSTWSSLDVEMTVKLAPEVKMMFLW